MSFKGFSFLEQERIIIKFLRKNKEGHTIKEIAERLKCNKITARLRLNSLVAKNKIKERPVGRYRLFYPKTRKWFFTSN